MKIGQMPCETQGCSVETTTATIEQKNTCFKPTRIMSMKRSTRLTFHCGPVNLLAEARRHYRLRKRHALMINNLPEKSSIVQDNWNQQAGFKIDLKRNVFRIRKSKRSSQGSDESPLLKQRMGHSNESQTFSQPITAWSCDME